MDEDRHCATGFLGSRGAHCASPFIVGLGRSGTTLRRLMLDSHPALAIPPETHFAPEVIRMCRRQRPSAEELADHLAGLRRWGDFGIGRDEILERSACRQVP